MPALAKQDTDVNASVMKPLLPSKTGPTHFSYQQFPARVKSFFQNPLYLSFTILAGCLENLLSFGRSCPPTVGRSEHIPNGEEHLHSALVVDHTSTRRNNNTCSNIIHHLSGLQRRTHEDTSTHKQKKQQKTRLLSRWSWPSFHRAGSSDPALWRQARHCGTSPATSVLVSQQDAFGGTQTSTLSPPPLPPSSLYLALFLPLLIPVLL